MIDDYCMEQSDRIFELEEQLRITEKALELACEELRIYCTPEGETIMEDFIKQAQKELKIEDE